MKQTRGYTFSFETGEIAGAQRAEDSGYGLVTSLAELERKLFKSVV